MITINDFKFKMLVDNVEFLLKDFQLADWIDRGLFSDAYIYDSEGVLHNVQQWYCNDTIVLNN